MRVRATKTGFNGVKIVKAGDEFDFDYKEGSEGNSNLGSWMEPVEDKPEEIVEDKQSDEGLEVDSRGLPWDERINAKNKAKDVKGQWKYKRGIDKDIIPEIEEQLLSD